jgi:hypothetical protein
VTDASSQEPWPLQTWPLAPVAHCCVQLGPPNSSRQLQAPVTLSQVPLLQGLIAPPGHSLVQPGPQYPCRHTAQLGGANRAAHVQLPKPSRPSEHTPWPLQLFGHWTLQSRVA